jgi:hypothetical protein
MVTMHGALPSSAAEVAEIDSKCGGSGQPKSVSMDFSVLIQKLSHSKKNYRLA